MRTSRPRRRAAEGDAGIPHFLPAAALLGHQRASLCSTAKRCSACTVKQHSACCPLPSAPRAQVPCQRRHPQPAAPRGRVLSCPRGFVLERRRACISCAANRMHRAAGLLRRASLPAAPAKLAAWQAGSSAPSARQPSQQPPGLSRLYRASHLLPSLFLLLRVAAAPFSLLLLLQFKCTQPVSSQVVCIGSVTPCTNSAGPAAATAAAGAARQPRKRAEGPAGRQPLRTCVCIEMLEPERWLVHLVSELGSGLAAKRAAAAVCRHHWHLVMKQLATPHLAAAATCCTPRLRCTAGEARPSGPSTTMRA